MRIKFTIGRKIGLGFGVVVLFTIVAFLFTNKILNDSKDKTEEVVQVVTPSVTSVEELNLMLKRAQNLITKWYYVPSRNDESFKQELRLLINVEYPKIKLVIDSFSVNWRKEDRESIKAIFGLTDHLFRYAEEEIMKKLNDFSTYNDSQLYFTLKLSVEEIDSELNLIDDQLNSLIASQKDNQEQVTDKMHLSFNFLQQLVKWLGIALVIGAILIALYTARSIVRPIKLLKKILQAMSKGILPKERMRSRSDEIGEMNEALTGLIGALESTTEFARQVGLGNFESHYEPLGENDMLGNALLKMRSDLRENERVLELKVIERTEEVVKQKEEIQQKNEELEVLYKHVTDSIRYAKRIQEAILPPDSLVRDILPNSFVLYKPKDIVSGDFYWLERKNGKSLVAAVDCTGHGVPGAFMSIVGYNLLKEIIANNEITSPSLIMDMMSEGVNRTLHNKVQEDANQTKDGMDMSLCVIDYDHLELEYAGAFNPMYLVRSNELIQVKGDKFPVGHRTSIDAQHFSNNRMKLQKGDMIYIFSDGYADQFGGPRGKKFMVGRFRDLLLKVSSLPVAHQKGELSDTLEKWRGIHEQVDDVLVIGFQI